MWAIHAKRQAVDVSGYRDGGKIMNTQNEYNFFNLQDASSVNASITALPIAKAVDLVRSDNSGIIPNRKAIVVNDQVVNIVSDRYALVQHSEAFRPIIEGLVLSGVKDFQYGIWNDAKRAKMNVYVGEAQDGVKFGFNVANTFDSSSPLTVGYSAYQKEDTVEIVEKEHVLVWGYRQVCANGMVVRVPLKATKYLDAVQVTHIKELITKAQSIKHMKGVMNKKLQQVQFITEAILLLQSPLNMMIIDSQKFKVTPEQAELLIKKYVGQRMIDKTLENFRQEQGNDLWSLYNSITYFASHEPALTISRRENFLKKAGNMLTAELISA